MKKKTVLSGEIKCAECQSPQLKQLLVSGIVSNITIFKPYHLRVYEQKFSTYNWHLRFFLCTDRFRVTNLFPEPSDIQRVITDWLTPQPWTEIEQSNKFCISHQFVWQSFSRNRNLEQKQNYSLCSSLWQDYERTPES